MWLGNTSRNFYGTGPWSTGPLEIVWEFETKFITGRLHKDPWGGSSWPGQPSVDESTSTSVPLTAISIVSTKTTAASFGVSRQTTA